MSSSSKNKKIQDYLPFTDRIYHLLKCSKMTPKDPMTVFDTLEEEDIDVNDMSFAQASVFVSQKDFLE